MRLASDLCPAAAFRRPPIVFGREDRFINRFAAMIRMLPAVPVIAPRAKLQPVYVGDVADAAIAALGTAAAGGTYELGGPEVLTMAALKQRIADATGRRRTFIEVPGVGAPALAGRSEGHTS